MSAAHQRILDALEHAPAGMTDPELEMVLGIPANSLRPRRRELVVKGQVVDSGLSRDPPGRRPSFSDVIPEPPKCIVWRLAREGDAPTPADGRKPAHARLKKALEPLQAHAERVAAGFDGLPDGTMVQFNARLSLGALRELLAAMET